MDWPRIDRKWVIRIRIRIAYEDGEYAKVDVTVHTNSIEGVWGNFKNFIRGMKGLKRHKYPLYLYEFMWRLNVNIVSPKSCYMIYSLIRQNFEISPHLSERR